MTLPVWFTGTWDSVSWIRLLMILENFIQNHCKMLYLFLWSRHFAEQIARTFHCWRSHEAWAGSTVHRVIQQQMETVRQHYTNGYTNRITDWCFKYLQMVLGRRVSKTSNGMHVAFNCPNMSKHQERRWLRISCGMVWFLSPAAQFDTAVWASWSNHSGCLPTLFSWRSQSVYNFGERISLSCQTYPELVLSVSRVRARPFKFLHETYTTYLFGGCLGKIPS